MKKLEVLRTLFSPAVQVVVTLNRSPRISKKREHRLIKNILLLLLLQKSGARKRHGPRATAFRCPVTFHGRGLGVSTAGVGHVGTSRWIEWRKARVFRQGEDERYWQQLRRNLRLRERCVLAFQRVTTGGRRGAFVWRWELDKVGRECCLGNGFEWHKRRRAHMQTDLVRCGINRTLKAGLFSFLSLLRATHRFGENLIFSEGL